MLSKLATLILGILAEKERNPYEITKMLNDLHTRKLLPLADSTVYATINNLKKKNLITGRQERSGNQPEKTIYNITPEGEFELHSSVTSFLEEDSSISSGFDIGILLMYNLSKPEILLKLKRN
jgi:DNA-binding PadR family transcriptional regulator